MLMFAFAALLSCAELCSQDARSWYSYLLAEGGYGKLQEERAAFLIREEDGSLTLAPWARGSFRRASFRGAVPLNTVALVHTHPEAQPEPSAHDSSEAARIRMPIVVVTPSSVVAVYPDGTRRRIFDDGWTR